MNTSRAFALAVAACLASACAAGAQTASIDDRSYASPTPITVPRIFGEGIISTRDDEFSGQVSRDGRTLWFSKSVPRFHLETIFVSTWRDNRWSEPEIAPFSGLWHDYDATLSADGERLYFISDRPLQSGAPHPNYDIWYLDRTASGWSDAKNIGAPINGTWSSHFAMTVDSGALYFTSDRPGGKGYLDIWMSRLVDGRYQEPENLGDAVNDEKWANFEVYVAPDESYLIASAYGHDDSLGDCDLYVSYRRNGVWQPLRNLGAPINSAARDYTARVTPDGRYLIFSSERGVPTDARTRPWTYREFTAAIRSVRNGLGNLYQVDLDVALPDRIQH
jgi:WD40-like Beta Propeller Repeat